MTRSDRLRPVQEFTDAKVQAAASTLSMRREELDVQQARLQQLIQYRDEYNKDFRLHGESSRDPAWIRNYQFFLSQLNDGINQQKLVIAECEQRCAQAQQVLMEATQKAAVLEHAVDRIQQDERRQQEQLEQRLSDEQAQSRWRSP